jgi:hypothetical protein
LDRHAGMLKEVEVLCTYREVGREGLLGERIDWITDRKIGRVLKLCTVDYTRMDGRGDMFSFELPVGAR